MIRVDNPLEIYRHLPKSNCKQCDLPTCLAFADAVIKGEKDLDKCPYLDDDTIEKFRDKIVKQVDIEQQRQQLVDNLKSEISNIDLSAAAERTGGSFSGEKLTIRVLGKEYFIDSRGNISSDCHLISWVTIPLLNYILYCKGSEPTGKWVPFRELKNGSIRQPLFGQRCEKPLKRIADTHMELLFEHIMSIFGGRPLSGDLSSDYSLILYPLPKVPILTSYCQLEGEQYSQLNILFDTSIEENLNLESVFMLGVGLVTMFEKNVFKHG